MRNVLKTIIFVIFGMGPISAIAQSKWTVDKAHSSVRFTVTHLMINEVEGSFRIFDGTLETSKSDFTDAVVNFTVDVNSINTENDMRDNHLKSGDFFDAQQFPTMAFKSISFKKVSESKYELKGNLTIKDVTKPVTFEVIYGGTVKDPYGNTKAGFKAKAVINRFDYGLKWNAITEAGNVVVSKEVVVSINVQFIQAK